MDSCTLYLDASGDTGWTPPFGKSKTEWYVLAGLVLTPEADLKAHKETYRILEKYVPEDVRAKFPDKMYELHYLDVIRGQNLFSHLEQVQLKALADEVFALLLDLKPVLFATAINKTQLKRLYGSHAHAPNRLGMRATIGRFSIYLQRENLIGSVTYDAEEYRKDKSLQEMILGFRRYGIVLTGQNYRPRMDDTLGNLLNTINMSGSETSPGIQLADFCSRSVWQHFEHEKSNRFNQISMLGDGNYEPSIFPPKHRWIK
jgi:hypothetical protein